MEKNLRIVYFGTPGFSADFLEKILSDGELPVTVTRVITQAPKKAGRRQILTESPVESIAGKHNLPVSHSPSDIPEDTDLALLFAFGRILPAEVLNKPRYGFWNIHPSLLPLYRGPAPVAGPLLHGDAVTGVTLMQMDEQMDHGPVIAQAECVIEEGDRRDILTDKLVSLGFALFKNTILSASGNIREIITIPQDHSKATYTKLFTKEDGFISDIGDPALYAKFKAYYPWPGLWTYITVNGERKRLKITQISKSGIEKVQMEGKKEVDFATFNKSYGVS